MSPLPEGEQEMLDWLYGTQLFGIKLGLESTRRLLSELELSSPDAKIIHVAGTNGKGSTCAFVHALLSKAGFRCGRFTSPHLIHFRERIRDSEREIGSAELVAILRQLRSTVSAWDPHPTFFELTLAAALMWFRDRQVDWIVLETGLGGRLDATNALQPDACILTSIGYDHTDVLGDTLTAIATEKAGILKPGVPVITAPQKEEAFQVIQDTAARVGSPLHVVEEPTTHSPLGIPGPHSATNAALALQVMEVLSVEMEDFAQASALAETHWPGRFQRIGAGDRLILDGSHNPDAIDALVRTWKEHFPRERAAIVYGGVAGKDHRGCLQRLEVIAAEWHLTPLQSPRALEPGRVAAWIGKGDRRVIHECPSLQVALESARLSSHRVLVTGSLYLVGEALALLDGATSFEPSSQ